MTPNGLLLPTGKNEKTPIGTGATSLQNFDSQEALHDNNNLFDKAH